MDWYRKTIKELNIEYEDEVIEGCKKYYPEYERYCDFNLNSVFY